MTARSAELLIQPIANAMVPRTAKVDLPSAGDLELEPAMLPRDAFSPLENSPAGNAIGRIAGEQITPSPGIPVIILGERITAGLLDYLRDNATRARGSR